MVNTIKRGDRLKAWFLDNVPKSMHWQAYTGHAINREKTDALSDLHDILIRNSDNGIATYFSEIKAELTSKAIAADTECEDQPVPKGWPEPTD